MPKYGILKEIRKFFLEISEKISTINCTEYFNYENSILFKISTKFKK